MDDVLPSQDTVLARNRCEGGPLYTCRFFSAALGFVQSEFSRKDAFFNFTRTYFGSHDAKLPQGWDISNEILNEFHDYLLKKQIEFTEAEWAQDHDWIKRSLKYEMYMTAFNMEDAKRVQAENDRDQCSSLRRILPILLFGN